MNNFQIKALVSALCVCGGGGGGGDDDSMVTTVVMQGRL